MPGSDKTSPASSRPIADGQVPARTGVVGSMWRALVGDPSPRRSSDEDQKPRVPRGSRAEASAGPDTRAEIADSRCDRMRADLKEVFSRVNGSRFVLRHLATLEHEMKKKGDAAFEDLPLGVLQRAALQLESLIEPPVPMGVAALRSRLGVALLARERVVMPTESPIAATTLPMPPPAVPPRRPGSPGPGRLASSSLAPTSATADTQPAVLVRERISSYIADGHIEVSEASVSDFEKAVTDWGLLQELPPPGRRNA